MTRQDDEHEDLRRLFSTTQRDASGATLTKLAARAADIPGLAERKPRFLPRWAWGPAFAGALVALAGLALAVRGATPKVAQPHTTALGSSTPVSVAVATASARELAAVPRPGVGSSDEPGEGAELLGDADESAHFDVSGPQSDRDLDAWLAATKELSGGT